MPATPPASAESLLQVIAALIGELHPGARNPRVTLDSRLDQDLGLDSLTRIELLARIERDCGVALPEQVLTDADTPRDLMRWLEVGSPRHLQAPASAPPVPVPETVEAPPADRVNDLVSLLEWHAQRHPDRVHIYLAGEGDSEDPITYGALAQEARRVAAELRARDLRPRETVAIMLPTGREYFTSFLGVLLAGGIPVPIYPPARATQIEEHLRRHARILASARCVLLITIPAARPLAQLLRLQVESLRAVITAAELATTRTDTLYARPGPHDIAFLQYTSGSTGNPKGVILTHANLLANIRAMGARVHADSSDVFVSWMPLYHDMGLIGAWLGSLYHAAPLVVMSPLRFLARPERWLWAIHRHRATLSGSPNFGYELCLKRVADEAIEGLDLSSWRMAFNGAEPVSPATLRRFHERFAPHGLRPGTLAPVYGLAECSVGLTMPRPGRPPVIDCIAREPFTRHGRAVPAAPEDSAPLCFPGCGYPLPDHEIRIVNQFGLEVPERTEGILEFRGPSATSGYYNNSEDTARLIRNGWLNSGDRAYLAGGEVYITGRAKDVIVRAGRNIYPHEIEEAVGNVPGVRKGCVVVFGGTDVAHGTERLVVVAETRLTEPTDHEQLRVAVRRAVVERAGLPPDEVVLTRPYCVLKTSSGKVRRAATRVQYEQGRLGDAPGSWRQYLQLIAAGLGPQLRRMTRFVREALYAARVWSAFVAIAPLAWTVAVVGPSPSWNQAIIRRLSRGLIRMAGLPLRVDGLTRLPPPPYIAVVNHASYSDAILLTAVLPPPYHFVAKREFADSFLTRRFLAGIGSHFVERFDRRQSVADARQVAQAARTGQTLLYFPEGTFSRAPGLRPFLLGAFTAAAEARIPVVPITLRGTRSVLRAEQWFPRRHPLEVIIGSPLRPDGSDWSAAVRLRDAARAEILRHCGEPDLAPAPAPAVTAQIE